MPLLLRSDLLGWYASFLYRLQHQIHLCLSLVVPQKSGRRYCKGNWGVEGTPGDSAAHHPKPTSQGGCCPLSLISGDKGSEG